MDKYILNESHQPVPCKDIMEWGKWFETADRCVAKEMIGHVRVSTVFLGIDHNFDGGAPLLFETMIFGGPHSDYVERCSTWDQAVRQHAVAVELVRSGLN
jgi:hypothetical protein